MEEKNSNEKEVTLFNKEEEYKEIIAPLVKDLVSTCAAHDIPMFVTAAYVNTERRTTYDTAAVIPGSIKTVLSEDKIRDHILVHNGFEVKLVETEDIEDLIGKVEIDDDDEFFKPEVIPE